LLKRLIPESIELQMRLGEIRGCIKVDRTQIEQVVLNVVVNARDALPDGGRIVIETGLAELDEHSVGMRSGVLPGRYVLLSVSDNGVGMTPDVRDRIFEPFFTTKELGRGTGLGLSTVYGIVKQSGGNIWVYSEPGLGTTFKIYFPLLDDDTAAAPAPREKPPDVAGGETILLVEDDWEVCKVVASMLSGQGYRILVAGHAQSAISMAENSSSPIDLLLTDMVMPGMNGDALAEAILRLSPGTAVLCMSGYTDHRMDMDRKCFNGGYHFIQKPFTADALLAKVRSVIEGALAARAHLAEN
jgi:CheY-like chemotaxis protein